MSACLVRLPNHYLSTITLKETTEKGKTRP